MTELNNFKFLFKPKTILSRAGIIYESKSTTESTFRVRVKRAIDIFGGLHNSWCNIVSVFIVIISVDGVCCELRLLSSEFNDRRSS